MVCLKAPKPEAGGVLHLQTSHGEFACPLAAGDGLLWEATSLEHWTTPIIATTAEPAPERVTLVGRYFLS